MIHSNNNYSLFFNRCINTSSIFKEPQYFVIPFSLEHPYIYKSSDEISPLLMVDHKANDLSFEDGDETVDDFYDNVDLVSKFTFNEKRTIKIRINKIVKFNPKVYLD